MVKMNKYEQEPFCIMGIYSLITLRGNYKLLGLMHYDGELLADETWITIRTRIKRVPFLHQSIRQSSTIRKALNKKIIT